MCTDLLYFLKIFSDPDPISQIKSRNTPEVEFLDISLTKDFEFMSSNFDYSRIQSQEYIYRCILVRHLIRAEDAVQFSQCFLLVLKQKTDQYEKNVVFAG
jgi:hypothetical protein